MAASFLQRLCSFAPSSASVVPSKDTGGRVDFRSSFFGSSVCSWFGSSTGIGRDRPSSPARSNDVTAVLVDSARSTSVQFLARSAAFLSVMPDLVSRAMSTQLRPAFEVAADAVSMLDQLRPAFDVAAEKMASFASITNFLIGSLDSVEPTTLGDCDSEFITIKGQTLHMKRKGFARDYRRDDTKDDEETNASRVPFILLHGFTASVFSWRCVMDDLAQLGPVVAFDRPPFGLSERPLPSSGAGGRSLYDTDSQADTTVALMDALGLEKAVIVGHSAGGTLAIRLAARHPHRVAGLALVAPAVFARESMKEKPGGGAVRALLGAMMENHVLGTLMMRIQFEPLYSSDPAKIREIGELNFHDLSKLTSEVVAGYMRPFRAKHWDAGLQQFYCSQWRDAFFSVQHDLPSVTAPALVIQGESDRIVPRARAEAVAAALPGAELRMVRECGHLPHEERPEETLRLLRDFVRRRVLPRYLA